ncbi:UNVERIFIED_ORG: hypothetical protein EDC92_10383 [Dietzia maris]
MKIWNDLTDRFDIEAVSALPEAGYRAAETIQDEPLIVAAMWQGLLQWIPMALAEQIRDAAPGQCAVVEGVSSELRCAVENAVTDALNSRLGDAEIYASLLDSRISEGIVRQVSDEFPLTPQSFSSSSEMKLKALVLAALVREGKCREAVSEAAALPTASQRAAGCDSIVWAYFYGPLSTEPLPDPVVSLIESTDWGSAPDHLDSIACILLRHRRDLTRDLLRRWTSSCDRRDDGRAYHRVASAIAWVADDHDLALSIALRDATPLGVADESQVNPAADYVLAQRASNLDERVDRLLRFSYTVDNGLSERALLDAATTLLASGEPMEAAYLFVLSNDSHRRRGRPGIGEVTTPWFTEAFTVHHNEKIALLKALQKSGVPGTVRFDRLQFDGPFIRIGGYHYPENGSFASERGVRSVARRR